MDKGVKYIWDILKEVAEEEGRSYEEVKELWRIHRAYVKEKMAEEDTYIIEIPHIGNLYFSGFLFRLFNGKSKKKYDDMKPKAEELYNKIEEAKGIEGSTKYTYPQERRTNKLKIFKSINLHIKGIKKRYSTDKKIIREIEEYSNNEDK